MKRLLIIFFILCVALITKAEEPDSTTFETPFGFELNDSTLTENDSSLICLPKYVLVDAAKDIVIGEAAQKELVKQIRITKAWEDIAREKGNQIEDFMQITESYERTIREYEEIDLFNESTITQLRKDNRNLRLKNTITTIGGSAFFVSTLVLLFTMR